MFVHIVTEPTKLNKVKKQLEKQGYTVSISTNNSNVMLIRLKGFPKNKQVSTTLENKFKKIKGIQRVQVIQRYLDVKNVDVEESLRTNNCRFVFDIDSTLTQGSPGTIHHIIEPIFQKIYDKGIRIYFVTGRSMPELNELIKAYPVEKHSIAENGGLILGFPPDNYLEFGSITEPKKILEYLQQKYSTKEDMEQGGRFTEVIFLKKDVTLEQIEEAKKAIRAKIEVHPSQNSYHISKNAINKGTAMLELATRLHWGNTMIIAVGDADMDIPMFEKAGHSYAVGNATDGAKKAASQVLNGKYEKGIMEIYDLIKKVS